MCGLCGLIYYGDKIPSYIIAHQLKEAFITLFKACAINGTDASGIAVLIDDKIYTYKNNVAAETLIHEKEVLDIFGAIRLGTKTKAILGHTRAQTKGTASNNFNNHPIVAGKTIGIHNGVITNDDLIFNINNLPRHGTVDSEVIFRLINDYLDKGESFIDSVKFTVKRLTGSMSCAFVYADNPRYIVLFNDHSFRSLKVRVYGGEKLIAFASTEVMLDKLNTYALFKTSNVNGTIDVNNSIIRIDVVTGKIYETTI